MASDRRPAPVKKSSRRTAAATAGLVALSALLALSASGTTVVEAARITNVGSSGTRRLQSTDQCAKCCKPKPTVLREGDTGGDGAGASGTGKGGKGSDSGGGRRLTKARRGGGRHEEADTTPERELAHKDKEPGAKKCVQCGDGEQKNCKLTAGQVGPDGLETKACPVDEPSGNCPDPFVVSADFEGSEYITSGVYDASREGGHEIDLDLQGGCGTKIVGTQPTRVSYLTKVEHDPAIIEGDGAVAVAAVAEYLEENLGYKAFCGANEAPAAGVTSEQKETIFIAPTPTSRNGGRKLEESFVTGFVPCSGAFQSTGSCEAENEGAVCNVYLGCVNIYCDHEASNNECRDDGIKILKENAGNAADPSQGILLLTVVGGVMGTEGAGNGVNSDIASVIGLETNGDGDSGLTNAGMGLVIGFSVLAALVVLLAVRKNRKAYTRDISFLDMEDMCSVDGDNIHLKPGDSSFDGTEIMSDGGTPSPTGSKWRKTRPGHVVDEDDSVLSGNNRQIVPRELVYGGALAPSDTALDVHQCNSAMCEICLARGVNPRFVPAHLEDSYHVEGDDRLNASDLSYGSRNYPMEDTVDF